MKFEGEPYQLLLAWSVAFSLLEPLVTLINYILSRKSSMKTIFQMYPKTSPFLVVVSEYIYFAIIFVKTMYIFKHFLKKPSYYPRRNSITDYRDFLICYVIVQLIIDVVWSITISQVTRRVPILDFVQNYSRELGVFALLRPLIYGICLLVVTDMVLRYLGDLEAIGSLLFALFMITIASF